MPEARLDSMKAATVRTEEVNKFIELLGGTSYVISAERYQELYSTLRKVQRENREKDFISTLCTVLFFEKDWEDHSEHYLAVADL